MIYYTASKYEPKWLSKSLYDLNGRIQNEFTVTKSERRPFEPFMLYFRGLEIVGSDVKHKGGARSSNFEMSRLSQGIRCVIQGCKQIIFK